MRLEGLADRLPRELSGGQQQRVALARALVIEPDILLLDEPLSNLDAKLRQEVRVEIRELQKKLGLTTVMVTHDQEEALTMADRLVVMSNGQVQQVGSQRDLYESPANTFVAGFVGRTNFLHGRVEITGRVPQRKRPCASAATTTPPPTAGCWRCDPSACRFPPRRSPAPTTAFPEPSSSRRISAASWNTMCA